MDELLLDLSIIVMCYFLGYVLGCRRGRRDAFKYDDLKGDRDYERRD